MRLDNTYNLFFFINYIWTQVTRRLVEVLFRKIKVFSLVKKLLRHMSNWLDVAHKNDGRYLTQMPFTEGPYFAVVQCPKFVQSFLKLPKNLRSRDFGPKIWSKFWFWSIKKSGSSFLFQRPKSKFGSCSIFEKDSLDFGHCIHYHFEEHN